MSPSRFEPAAASSSRWQRGGELVASVLVADDDAAIRTLLRRALAGEGHEVMTVPNGRDALEHIDIAEPDLLILDLMMPLVSEWAVYTQLPTL